MAFKVIKQPESELEQAAVLLALPREDIAATLAPAGLVGHRVSDDEIDDFLGGLRSAALTLAVELGYIERVS